MKAKEFLLQGFHIDNQIKVKKEQIQMLRDMQTDISSTICGDRVQTSRKNDKIGDITSALLDLIDEYAKDVTMFLKIKYDIKMAIEKIENMDYRCILEWRYINLCKWEDIATKMNYNERWVHKVHKKAIDEIEKIIEDMASNKI